MGKEDTDNTLGKPPSGLGDPEQNFTVEQFITSSLSAAVRKGEPIAVFEEYFEKLFLTYGSTIQQEAAATARKIPPFDFRYDGQTINQFSVVFSSADDPETAYTDHVLAQIISTPTSVLNDPYYSITAYVGRTSKEDTTGSVFAEANTPLPKYELFGTREKLVEQLTIDLQSNPEQRKKLQQIVGVPQDNIVLHSIDNDLVLAEQFIELVLQEKKRQVLFPHLRGLPITPQSTDSRNPIGIRDIAMQQNVSVKLPPKESTINIFPIGGFNLDVAEITGYNNLVRACEKVSTFMQAHPKASPEELRDQVFTSGYTKFPTVSSNLYHGRLVRTRIHPAPDLHEIRTAKTAKSSIEFTTVESENSLYYYSNNYIFIVVPEKGFFHPAFHTFILSNTSKRPGNPAFSDFNSLYIPVNSVKNLADFFNTHPNEFSKVCSIADVSTGIDKKLLAHNYIQRIIFKNDIFESITGGAQPFINLWADFNRYTHP